MASPSTTPSATPSTSTENLVKDRHCAFCLISISGAKVNLCGKCNRRAYCSRECQVKDWKSSPKTGDGPRGQGHKHWCDLRCGEEDLDWKVAPVEGKGLGLIALKAFPARSRILVDAGQISAEAHPAIKDLMPPGETNLKEKWELNSFDGAEEDPAVCCLRLARANHACKPNAGHVYWGPYMVKILFAERDIAAGEEICINYQQFADPSTEKSPVDLTLCKLTLESKWGIICPEDCFCKNAKVLEDAQTALDIYSDLCDFAENMNKKSIRPAMRAVRELMDLHEGTLCNSYLAKCRTLRVGFQLGIMTSSTLAQGVACLKKLLDIMQDILPPNAVEVQEYQGFKDNIESHPYYLNHESRF